jgi:predicted transposase YbfD/YdcC
MPALLDLTDAIITTDALHTAVRIRACASNRAMTALNCG